MLTGQEIHYTIMYNNFIRERMKEKNYRVTRICITFCLPCLRTFMILVIYNDKKLRKKKQIK